MRTHFLSSCFSQGISHGLTGNMNERFFMPLIRVRPLGGGATRNEDMPDSPPVKQSKGMENDHEKDINGT